MIRLFVVLLILWDDTALNESVKQVRPSQGTESVIKEVVWLLERRVSEQV